MLRKQICDLGLSADEADLDAVSPERLHEPMNRDAVRSRHMPQGVGTSLPYDFDDGIVVLCKDQLRGGMCLWCA